MSQLSKAQFETKYADAAGEFATNGTGAITGAVLQEFSQDISDSLFTGRVIILDYSASGLTFQECGSTPLPVTDDVGASNYVHIHRIAASFDAGVQAYNFGAGNDIELRIGSTVIFSIARALINGGSDFIKIASISSYDGVLNTGLTLTTTLGGDATAGNGGLRLYIYYTIETLATAL